MTSPAFDVACNPSAAETLVRGNGPGNTSQEDGRDSIEGKRNGPTTILEIWTKPRKLWTNCKLVADDAYQ